MDGVAFLALIVAGGSVIVLLATAIAVFLTYLAAEMAAEKGRSQLAWAAVTLAAAALAGTLGIALAWRALEGDSPSTLALFLLLLPPPFAGMSASGVIVWLARLEPRPA